MKITFISDTHLKHEELGTLEGEILVHCGDFTRKGSKEDIQSFLEWMSLQRFQHKIFVAGNHDFGFENADREWAEDKAQSLGLTYLNDSGIEIDGFKFWGSPIQPEFLDWAFNRQRGAEIQKHWDMIPSDTDVLITHGPPYGILDLCSHGERVGCQNLLNELERIRPRVHAFGHIHEDYGRIQKDNTIFINASILDVKYDFRNQPIVVEL